MKMVQVLRDKDGNINGIVNYNAKEARVKHQTPKNAWIFRWNDDNTVELMK